MDDHRDCMARVWQVFAKKRLSIEADPGPRTVTAPWPVVSRVGGKGQLLQLDIARICFGQQRLSFCNAE